MEKLNLVVIEVTPDNVKAQGPMSNAQALALLTRKFAEQPLQYFADNNRIYIANLETGEIKKPTLKLGL